MTSNKVLTSTVLEVTARELNDDLEYTFQVEEFSNGLILVAGETTNDWFFDSADEIEPNGSAYVVDVKNTNIKRQWTALDLLRSIQGSIKEFGEDAVPEKHLQLWK